LLFKNNEKTIFDFISPDQTCSHNMSRLSAALSDLIVSLGLVRLNRQEERMTTNNPMTGRMPPPPPSYV